MPVLRGHNYNGTGDSNRVKGNKKKVGGRENRVRRPLVKEGNSYQRHHASSTSV